MAATETWAVPSVSLILPADPAADFMTPNPVSIRDGASVQEAMALLTDKGLSAVPVIDDAGRAVGVLSKTDILVHERAQMRMPDSTLVRDLMTPAVFSVSSHTPADKVVEQMLALKVHRLFVVDRTGVLIGVITALDLLRQLRRPAPPMIP
jgi:CBS domain-containing protein